MPDSMVKDKGKQVVVPYSGPLLGNPTAGPSTTPSASLASLWAYLEPALDHIVRSPSNNTSKAPAIDVEYHMGIHTSVYNYFTTQSQTYSVDPRPNNEFEKASGIDLYERLDKYYADVARELFLGTPLDDSTLVHYLVPCFNRYSAGAMSVNRLLNYVNRHFVKRAVDEDKGWLRLNDVLDAVAKMIKEGDARDQISKKLKEKRTEELKRWGYEEGAPSEVLAQAECSAEAASDADRIVPLASLAYRRFRIEILDPLLAVPKVKGKKKPKRAPPNGEKPQPKGRLARAVKELLESDGGDEEDRRRVAEGLANTLRMSGIRVDHPLRKRLDKYLSTAR